MAIRWWLTSHSKILAKYNSLDCNYHYVKFVDLIDNTRVPLLQRTRDDVLEKMKKKEMPLKGGGDVDKDTKKSKDLDKEKKEKMNDKGGKNEEKGKKKKGKKKRIGRKRKR